jgi:hypothetical protein
MLCMLRIEEEILAALRKPPPTLDATYRQIYECEGATLEERAMMRKTIHLVAFNEPRLTICEIRDYCEASSTPNMSVTEEKILSLYSSFIRKSTDGNYFELTHYTVKEFLSHVMV